jgi:hypothetical protein
MNTIITKGQASCLVLGEDITPDNRRRCKQLVEDSLFEVVYRYDTGNRCPMVIGSRVVRRDSLTYMQYPDTPSSEPNVEHSIYDENKESRGKLLRVLSVPLNYLTFVDSATSQDSEGNVFKSKESRAKSLLVLLPSLTNLHYAYRLLQLRRQ